MDKIDPFNSNTFFPKSGSAVNKNWQKLKIHQGTKLFN